MATQVFPEWNKKYGDFISSNDIETRKKYLNDDDFISDAFEYLVDIASIQDFTKICYEAKKELFNEMEFIKPLTLKNADAIQYSDLKDNVKAMREIANQDGMHPMILCYADSVVQNDLGFVTSVIVNAGNFLDFETTTDKYGSSFRYSEYVGKDIQTNPMFWELINAMSRKKLGFDLFDSTIELESAIKRFKELDNKEEVIEDKIIVELSKEDFRNATDVYMAKFTYSNQEQIEYMDNVFNEALIPLFGSNSARVEAGYDYIKPYRVDGFGNFSVNDTGIIGGTEIPEDLLPVIVKGMVEKFDCKVKCGEYEMVGRYNLEMFGAMCEQLKSGKGQK